MLNWVFKKVVKLREKVSKDLGQGDVEKPFLEHLEDLRTMLVRMALTLAVFVLGTFIFYDRLWGLVTYPIHLAGLELAAGRCDMAVTGGVDTFNDIFMFMCFSKTPALSPTGDAKPFDGKSDGTILGEGLGIVVLKRLADAERDGDRIYAVIRSVGSSSDGKGNAIYAPSASGQMKALRNAYRLAGVTPDTIELVEGHGTGTRVGDAVEVSALTEVYRDAKAEGTWCALGSVKSQIGHTKAAAGAAGLIKAALALYTQVLPPTIKIKEPIEALRSGNSPIYINTEKRPWIARPEHPRRAAVSAFGFGGSNFHCVLEEHPSSKDVVDWEGDVEIVALSAANPAALKQRLADYRTGSESAAESRSKFSPRDPCRLLFVVNRDSTDLLKLLDSASAKLNAEPEARFWRIPDGAYYGTGPVPGRLAVLFPGQGSQYVGMLRDLACTFPPLRDVLAHANRVFERTTGNRTAERLSDQIYPLPAFSKVERERNDQRLRDTQVAQPAIGAVSLGALKILEEFGLNPDAYAGHSYGELPALCAAGCFDAEALHTMSRLRGHLMASYHGGDAGSMLAVHAPLATIEAVLHEEALDLVVANRNAPGQSVLSGRSGEIDRAITCLDRREVRHTKLAVAAAFHSPLVASAKKPFREALGELEFRPAGKEVFANTSGRAYPKEPEAVRELLAGQLACPVDFVREIASMAEGGVRTFIEVGPGSTLTKLATAILAAPENAHVAGWDAFALDASTGKRSGVLDLAHALARLAAHGYDIDLQGWQRRDSRDVARIEKSKPGLIVPICGANYVQPKKKPAVAKNLVESLSTPHALREEYAPVPAPPQLAKPMQAPRTAAPETRTLEVSANPEALTQALQVTQQSLSAFSKLQEQTAQLHKQFLENQEAAQRTLQMLVEQQQSLLTGQPFASRTTHEPAARARVAPSHQPRLEKPRVEQRPIEAAPLRQAPPMPNGDLPVAIAKPPTRLLAPTPPPVKAAPSFDVAPILLAIIAEKTGYPAEMLSPEMALEADLGIDSIKRVEIFSALQERLPDAPAVKPEHLGTLHTLRDVIEFLSKGKEVAPAAPISRPIPQVDSSGILFQVVSEKTGYPPEMLNLEMALDADLGIDSIKRVEIFSALQERLPDAPIVKPEHLGTLHTLGDVVAFLSKGHAESVRSVTAPEALRIAPREELAEVRVERSVLRAVPLNRSSPSKIALPAGSTVLLVADLSPLTKELLRRIEIDGYRPRVVSWNDLPKASDAADAAGLILLVPTDRTFDDLPLRAFRWLRHAAAGLKAAATVGGALFATVSRLDGSFGLDEIDPERDPRQGALAGLAKTAAHEWPDVSCKAIDLDPNAAEDLAASIWEEIVQRGPVEVGISSRGKIALELRSEPIQSANGSKPLAPSDVVLITGGARGVTAEVARAIAERFRPTIVLMGRTAIDEPEPDWLAGCETESAIKRALAGRGLTKIEPEYRRIEARREAVRNIDAMRQSGSQVIYKCLDVTDAAAVKSALRGLSVTCLIHGAGVLADRRIEELSDEQFAAVYATKVHGLESLLKALEGRPLKSIVLFSSSTGRFGRIGQIAYAAANEALNKIARQQARKYPACKVSAINWGPWDGGMVTPALRKMFAVEGVGVIPLRQGSNVLIDELSAEKSAVEVTVIARPATEEAAIPVVSAVPLHLAFEQTVSLTDQPILRSHVIDGRPVLPLALHLEWLAQAALHGNPGYAFHGLNDFRLLHGVTLEDASSIRVKALAGHPTPRDGGFVVPVELHGKRGAKDTIFSRAEIVLVNRLPTAEKTAPLPALKPYPKSVSDAYRSYLFHGPDLSGIERIEGVGATAIAGTCRMAPPPAEWLHHPLRSTWIADPLAIDAAFQLMILWSFAERGAGCLPCFVGKYRQYRKTFATGPVRIAVRIVNDNAALVRADIDFIDSTGDLIARIENHESVIDEKLDAAFRKNRVAV